VRQICTDPLLLGLFAACSLGLPQMTAADPGAIRELQGRCEYGNKAAGYPGPQNSFLFCRSVLVDLSGAVEFRDGNHRRVARYEGQFDGDTMSVESLDVPRKEIQSARGSCRIFRRDGEISTVTCVGIVHQHSYAANFVPHRDL